MKRYLALLLLFSLILSSFTFAIAASAEEVLSPYSLAESFATAYPARDILSGGEKQAATALTSFLTARGYTVSTPSFQYTEEDALSNKKVAYDYSHVVGRLSRGKGKTILIGCYYGGVTASDANGVGQGASIAFSVGAVLYLADKLADLNCAYDLAIAFWGGVEVSDVFDLSKCGVPLEEIALYIDLDGVAAGDHDYLYADDVPRSQESFFRDIIADCGVEILSAPLYKKPVNYFYEDDLYTHTHLGLFSTTRFFLNADLPCVGFVGGAWDYDCGLYRYSGKGELEGTSLDTIQELDKLNGGKEKTEKRLLAVCEVVSKALTSDQLKSVLDRASSETSGADLNSSLAYYLVSFIGLGGLLLFFILFFALQRKDRRETVWEPSFGKESADPYEELRSEGDISQGDENENVPSQGDPDGDGDDVFRF